MSDWQSDFPAVQEAILEILETPGTRTKRNLIEEAADRTGADPKTAKRQLGLLLVDEYVEEHPDFDGAYRIREDPR